MKNLLIYINPRKDFGDEEKIAIKIQIDNSIELGWKKRDILLVTNFFYEYKGIKALQIGDENYCDFCPQASKINAIITLFDKNIIKKAQIYWFHDFDAFQLVNIPRSELDMDKIDLYLADFGRKPRWNTGSIFFKYEAKDIFCWIRDIAYKYQTDEERALMILTGHDEHQWGSSKTIIKGYTTDDIPQLKNIIKRIKKANISYNFHSINARSNYNNAIKPIKVAHFHIIPRPLNPMNGKPEQIDFFLRGINKINQQIVPERLAKIFYRHGIRAIIPKKMKNLMIYINLSGKLPKKEEILVKMQIDNSPKFGWKRRDLILVTNFPYSYRGIKTIVLDNSLFNNLDRKAYKFNVLSYLSEHGVINCGELWWYHDLDVFQLRRINKSEIDLENAYVGLISNFQQIKLVTNNIFFKIGCQKVFGWTRNTLNKLNIDEVTALTHLTEINYRGINSMYKRLNLSVNFTCFKQPDMFPKWIT